MMDDGTAMHPGVGMMDDGTAMHPGVWDDGTPIDTSIDHPLDPPHTDQPVEDVPHTVPVPTWRLFLSHHPVCHRFSEDVLTFKGVHFCIGCFIALPVAISVLALIWSTTGPDLPPSFLFPATILLLSSEVATYFTDLSKRARILQKVIFGVGMALLMVTAAWVTRNDHWLQDWFLPLFLVMVVLGVMRYRKLDRVCSSCEFDMDDPRCTGVNMER